MPNTPLEWLVLNDSRLCGKHSGFVIQIRIKPDMVQPWFFGGVQSVYWDSIHELVGYQNCPMCRLIYSLLVQGKDVYDICAIRSGRSENTKN
jgi:hypothetical protein